MKQKIISGLSLAILAGISSCALAGTNDAAMDLLIQKLVDKGVLKSDEAKAVMSEMQQAVSDRNKEISKDVVAEIKPQIQGTTLKSKAKTIEFEGLHYFGLTSSNPKVKTTTYGDSSGFDMRRNYLGLKAYFNDTDYFRITMDATKEIGSTTTYANTFIKYAYLWLDNVLPNTGIEVGIAHRPWIDYEEHNSWYYRSVNKTTLEHKTTRTEHGPDLVNSADLGIDFKTKTKYFTSEIGFYNGEGYHADKTANNQQNSGELSTEWRLTAHPFGDGEKVGKYDKTKDRYFHISTYGLISKNHKDNSLTINDAAEYDRSFYGVHTVYNQPLFLVAANAYTALDEYRNGSQRARYNGYSVNGEIRPFKDWMLIGRYDAFDKDTKVNSTGITTNNNKMKQWIYGVSYDYSKFVQFSLFAKDIKDRYAPTAENKVYMLTSQVKW